ncbi:MAG: anti-sigma F factor [Clostridia bacterium]|jgi:stage II sporulation protein AB (anti-sigma F factor)|nr:anti-sigma F factor [Clostridia bacterium]
MTKNYLKLQFYSLPRNQAFARDAVAAFCLELNPSLSDLSDVKTAVSEAVTNCTVHAYKGNLGIVTIECEIEENALHIKVSDTGRGIADINQAVQPFYTSAPSDERSGMGFTIMQTFMDEFKVNSIQGEGTVVYMSKSFKAEVENA